MKIIDFIKNNKVPTIAASVVLVAAIAVGVTFGVLNHKDNIKANPSEDRASSAESSSVVSSTVEDSSSEVNTSSEDNVSSVVSEVESVSTPSKTESVSSAQSASSKQPTTSSKPVSSAPSNTTSSKPATSTPSNGGNTGIGSKWVCPDPAAHGSDDGTFCRSPQEHQENIAEYNRLMEEAKNQKPIVVPDGYTTETWCPTCQRPRGDGHNGTCVIVWDDVKGSMVHTNYD